MVDLHKNVMNASLLDRSTLVYEVRFVFCCVSCRSLLVCDFKKFRH